MAVGEQGDIVVVGGTGVGSELLRDILHYRDVDREKEVRRGVGLLPWASRAQTVHALGGREFIAVGGTTATDQVLARAVTFEVGDTEADVVVGDAIDLEQAGAPDPARAHHAGVVLDDGRVLVIGGCRTTVQGECAPIFDDAIGSAFYLEPAGSEMRIDADAPALNEPRFDHTVLVSRDGFLFVVGGFQYVEDIDGSPLRRGAPYAELLHPGLDAWARYGPVEEDPVADPVVGATLLEGGLIVTVTASGEVYVADEITKWRFSEWCDDVDDATLSCFLDDAVLEHTLLALPGERVLADNFLLPVAQVGGTGAGAVDISDEGTGEPPPGARADAAMALLDDGSVIIAGGRAPASSALSSPVLLRFRPDLDGPDEREPVLEGLPAGSLLTHDGRTDGTGPRVEVADGVLYLRPDPDPFTSAVQTWVHVRAFLSRRFRLQATIGSEDDAFPRFVFSQGAIAKNTVSIDPDAVRFHVRDVAGEQLQITCADRGLDFRGRLLQVVIDVSPDAVELRHDGQTIARCPWTGNLPVAVGIGAFGNGVVTVRSIGLSRG
jgi:hypothetical protein